MQLTTPELKDFDSVFPAENWFLYWKTSPSLWESKLNEYRGPAPIFVPIYWGMHSENAQTYDFGEKKPETDLVRLYQCAKKLNKSLIFLLPVSPAPFLTNGGIPAYLARTISLDQNAMALSAFDNELRLNKIYSFYDPRIFQAYRRFCKVLGDVFVQRGIGSSLYGLDCFRFDKDDFKSYFEDYSAVYENGFNRYIKQLQEDSPEQIEKLIQEPDFEANLSVDYLDTIQGLYTSSLNELIAGNYFGEVKVCFLGGNSEDLFGRSSYTWYGEAEFFKGLFSSLTNGYMPCSLLLNYDAKKDSLKKALKENLNTLCVHSFLKETDFSSDEELMMFRALTYFEHYNLDHKFDFNDHCNRLGLSSFLSQNYQWCYKVKNKLELDYDDLGEREVYFFYSQSLNNKEFTDVLKLFLHGKKIILDSSALSEEKLKRLEIFYTENNLNVEKLNFVTSITKANLGDGFIISYDGEKLSNAADSKKRDFWTQIIKYVGINHLEVKADEGVEYIWNYRSSNSYELSYEEVRRVSLYNPTSYKRFVQVKASHNFAFVRSIDEVNASFKSTPHGIEVSLMPGGSVSLDYGYFE